MKIKVIISKMLVASAVGYNKGAESFESAVTAVLEDTSQDHEADVEIEVEFEQMDNDILILLPYDEGLTQEGIGLSRAIVGVVQSMLINPNNIDGMIKH